jgi:STE24 endopeptidase
MLLILLFGGFGWLSDYIREYTFHPVYWGVIFFSMLILIQTIFSIPLSYYSTFVIEEKFGFNKMTKKLFVLDTIKGLLLSLIL